MTPDLWTALNFLGGIGLFLLGMKLMTDGLRVAAGDALRRILSASTASRTRAVGSGIMLTGVVQSSSAVIFATIGFVNAGILGLTQAVGVIYGANVGTTVTSWLVSAVGLEFSLRDFALPIIAVGMLLSVLGRKGRQRAFGEAIAGFGVFFLGLDLLTGMFREADVLVPADTDLPGLGRILLAFLGGFAMTVLMQSSSAAIAVTLTAVAGGLIGLPMGAAMLIGANVGTTSTAVFASIGATPNARRVAASHVIFNLLEAVIMLGLLGMWLAWAEWFAGHLVADPASALILAVYHSTGKLITLILIWPLTGPLVERLRQHFQPSGALERQPAFLDDAVLSTPTLAIPALVRELDRITTMTRRLLVDALSGDRSAQGRFSHEQTELHALVENISEATQRIPRSDSSAIASEALPNALRILRYLDEMIERADELRSLRLEQRAGLPKELLPLAERLEDAVRLRLEEDELDPDREAEFHRDYQSLKARLLAAGASRRLSTQAMAAWLDYFSGVRRVFKLAGRATSFLRSLRELPEDESD